MKKFLGIFSALVLYAWTGCNIGAVIGFVYWQKWGWVIFYVIASLFWGWLAYKKSKYLGWIK